MPEPIRVLELLVSTELGGAPTHVRDLAAGLPREEFDLTVAGPPGGSALPLFEALGVAFVPIATDGLRLGTLRRVIRLVRDRRIEVIHSHGKGAGLYGRVAARMTGAAAVHTFHGIHYRDYPPGLRGLYLALERRLSRWSHAVVHVSGSQAREAERLALEPRDRRHVIVNAVDVAAVQGAMGRDALSRGGVGLDPDALVLGTVARFDPVKALDVLLRAFARLRRTVPTAQLLLVGGGPQERRLRAEAVRLGIMGRVVFAGPALESARYLSLMDLYVTASRREGMPLAVLEAMAGGLAVVATRVTGHEDTVEDGTTGLLVPADDPDELARACARLLGDPARRRLMGEAGRRRVETRFALPRMIAEVATLYRAAAGRFGGR
jgi:glycosyltransferase involved in cell wall biosynthesis